MLKQFLRGLEFDDFENDFYILLSVIKNELEWNFTNMKLCVVSVWIKSNLDYSSTENESVEVAGLWSMSLLASKLSAIGSH